MKINFTSENKSRLEELALKFLFNNVVFTVSLGTVINVVDLLHNTAIKSLVYIYTTLKKEIATLEESDRWSMTDTENKKLAMLKEKYEFVDLLIGYKKYCAELEEIEKKKIELAEKIDALKDSQKTPAERIAELEKQLSEL